MTAHFDLAGETVMITGGGRGLGRAIADGFAVSGATVAILGRDETKLAAAVAEMREAGSKAHFYVANVADEAALAAAAERMRGEIGDASVLVNNAGINPWYRRAEQVSLAEWRHILEINLTAVFHCCQLVAPAMLAKGRGSIINISSVAGHIGLARTAAYCAAKGGVELLTKSLAIDWADLGVRVNTVAPGYFQTDLTAGLEANDALSAKVLGHTPLGRFGRPEEIVAACLYLASDASSYVTGQSLRVDGGFTAS